MIERPWDEVFRVAFAHQFTTTGLEALARALATDDPALQQVQTIDPPLLLGCGHWPVKAACAVAYACWRGGRGESVEEVDLAFADVCYCADLALGNTAGCYWLLGWWDRTPRALAFAALLVEVRRELRRRKGRAA